MEDMLKTGEKILFKYPLKNYFVVVLPPSFPYGGMENPITTFATPTIVVGDKSAANVICHEIAHSWTGNYLTNSSWEDFWLNEGFTRYVEAKMVKHLYGETAWKHMLKRALTKLEGVLMNKAGKGSGCVLCPTIADFQNPDDILGSTQYEKGFYFLYFLEQLVSEEKFFEFLRQYLQKREGANINTQEFSSEIINFIKDNFDEAQANEIISKIDWKEWLYSGELPPVIPEFEFNEWKEMEEIFEQFKQGKIPENVDVLLKDVWLFTAFTNQIMLEEGKL